MPLTGDYEPSTWEMVADQVARFEASDGSDGAVLNGAPCIVMTYLGAKSGKLRKAALIRVTDGERYAVLGSMGGAPKAPSWVFCLRADPRVELQDGPTKRDYLARETSGDEKAEWWARATEAWPPFDDYQAKTTRVIPLFVLEPAPEPHSG